MAGACRKDPAQYPWTNVIILPGVLLSVDPVMSLYSLVWAASLLTPPQC